MENKLARHICGETAIEGLRGLGIWPCQQKWGPLLRKSDFMESSQGLEVDEDKGSILQRYGRSWKDGIELGNF